MSPRWLTDIGDTVIGNRGYFAIGSVVAAYSAVFGLIDAKATQEETRASVERSLFMTLVSSGRTHQPNMGPMYEWAVLRLGLCDAKAKDCSKDGKVRIELIGADLSDAEMGTAKLDNQGQLDQACGRPSLPKRLHPAKPCPEAEQLGHALVIN